MGNWIQLTSGGAYDFDRCVITGPFTVANDIARSLSGLNRFVAHTNPWWDVAAHSVVVARVIEDVTGDIDAAAGGLLHEMHEAVIGDIPTPVAWALDHEKIKHLKNEVQTAIYWRLKTPMALRTEAHHDAVEQADHAALYAEKQLLMVPEPMPWSVKMPDHEWMLAAHRHMHSIGPQLAEHGAAAVFMHEYRRLVERKEDKQAGRGPQLVGAS